MLEKLEILKDEYYKKNGVKPNVLMLGHEEFSNLIKDKKTFKFVTVGEHDDKLNDLIILQVHKRKMFKVGYVD